MATKTYREKTNMDSKWWWWWWCVALYVCNRNSENVSSLNAKAHEWYACVGFIHTRTLLAICQWPLIKPFQKRVRETENKDEEKEKQKMKADMWLFRVFRFFFLEQTALKCLSRKKKTSLKRMVTNQNALCTRFGYLMVCSTVNICPWQSRLSCAQRIGGYMSNYNKWSFASLTIRLWIECTQAPAISLLTWRIKTHKPIAHVAMFVGQQSKVN